MTNHKATLVIVGFAVLLYSSQSRTAADEKQQVTLKTTFLVIYRPRLRPARDPNRRTVQRRTECRAAFAPEAGACIDSCSSSVKNLRASARSANAAGRRPIRPEAARRPET